MQLIDYVSRVCKLHDPIVSNFPMTLRRFKVAFDFLDSTLQFGSLQLFARRLIKFSDDLSSLKCGKTSKMHAATKQQKETEKETETETEKEKEAHRAEIIKTDTCLG